MSKLVLISHKNLIEEQLDQILRIKSVSWPYTYEQQLEWMKHNIKDSDIHVLLYNDKDILIAYLNLIDIKLYIDNQKVQALGIGNVCALERGKSWGKDLILRTNEILKSKKMMGILFCKDELLKFYLENDWLLISPENLKIKKEKEVNTLIYNREYDFEYLEYYDLLF